MEDTYSTLVNYILEKLPFLETKTRLLIAIAGVPGSGKTSLARTLISNINNRHGMEVAAMIPMDGFHYPKSALDKFANPKEAHDRRGSHWTFDVEGLLVLTRNLRAKIDDEKSLEISAPSFDHAVGDPIPDDIKIFPHHRIIILEGLYLHLSKPDPWLEISKQMDELWFVEVDMVIARTRVIRRHLTSGIAKDKKSAIFRVENNDMPNAEYLLKNRVSPTRVIQSIEDEREIRLSEASKN
ncbi:hypothetical protein G9A89_010018 [Geosiphon pyriformis]|nr:hypothetical protein G9A89_010018 [Geosiphon pyriformis]